MSDAATAQPELEPPIEGGLAEAPPAADVEPHTPDAPPPVVTRDIALRPSRDPLVPIDPDQVVASMEAYQQMLPRLLDSSDFQDAGGGKRFVTRSGWRKIARAFNLSIVLVSHRVERDMNDDPLRAEVVVRAIAPNGQCQDGDGYCDAKESRFRGNAQKLEHDLRATATTRAKSRAIADLVGMGDVSAEEVDAGAASAQAQPASEELRDHTRGALLYLLDGELAHVDAAEQKLAALTDGDGTAALVLQSVLVTATALKNHREAQAA